MAVVNKFNVNKQQVTLDPDIIENMSANDVSYNSSLQYDENTVGDKLSELGKQIIYDVTVNNDGATFTSLSALLLSENLSTLIPIDVRCGGMSIRFIQSSDNKYVQYRLMSNEFTTDTTQWVIADEGIYMENPEFVYVKTDKDDKILWAIKTDGSIYYGAGVPQQVIDYIEEKLAELSLDEYEDIVAFLDDLEKDNKTLQTLLNEKVDREENKSLIDKKYASTKSTIDNPEFIEAKTDSEGKILAGRTSDGIAFENVGFSTPKISIRGHILENIEDPEGRTEIITDAEDKIIAYRDKDGVLHENRITIKQSIEFSNDAMTNLKKSLIESGFNLATPIDWSNEKTISLPISIYCAKVNIISETGLAITKTQNKRCVLQYWDKSGNYFQKYIILNAQGSSSMSYIEKNQSIDIFNDEACEESCDIIFGNWIAQDSFHLKCYYIDVFRGIANIGYSYCEDVIREIGCRNNRVVLDNSSITDVNSTGNFDIDFGDGALCHPDGFPIELYVNGDYYGLFAWNLKKHRKNYSMSSKDYSVTLLDGVLDEFTFFGNYIDWTQFELRNPKNLVTMDGTKYDADNNCNELIDDTSEVYDPSNPVHVGSAKIKTLIIRQSKAIVLVKAENDISNAKKILAEYYDIDALSCYFIISNVLYNYDGFRKNWIWTIYDKISAPTFYDLDSIFGRSWTGCNVVEDSKTNILGTNLSLPTGQLVRLYKNELNAIYKSLRNKNIISVSTIMQYVYNWVHKVGLVEYKKNIDAWPSIPSYRKEKTENDGTYDGGMFDSPKRIELWLTERIKTLDSYFEYV